MIPKLDELKGYITEIHGSSDSGKTKTILEYILKNQESNNIFTCIYIDTSNQLRDSSIIRKIDDNRIWYVFLKNNILMPDFILQINKYVDLIIIDDFANLKQNPWHLLKKLYDIANITHTAILLTNQQRYVMKKINAKKQYTYQPYRYNIIKTYCKYSIDLDSNEIKKMLNCSFALGEDLAELITA
jgi:RecA/RadA recombinase